MKHLILLLFFSNFVFTQEVWVNTSSGGYWRTLPNSTNRDNYSTIGNINPHTGKAGTISPDNNVQFFNSAEAALNNLLSQPVYNLPSQPIDFSYLKPEINIPNIVQNQYKTIEVQNPAPQNSAPVNKGGKYFSINNGKKNYVKQTIHL